MFATVVLTVLASLLALLPASPRPNLPPIANDDTVIFVYQPSYVDIRVLDNDKDPEGHALTVVEVSTLEGGSASILKDNVVRVYLNPLVTPPDHTDPLYLLAQGSYLVSDGVNANKAQW